MFKLFKKNKKEVTIDGSSYEIDDAVYYYIKGLKDEIDYKNKELKEIKPIVESCDYKPAMSRDCVDCKYVIRSTWDGSPVACRKDNLCLDFARKED